MQTCTTANSATSMKPDNEEDLTLGRPIRLQTCRVGLLFRDYKPNTDQDNSNLRARMAYRFLQKRSKRTSMFFIAISYVSFIIILLFLIKGAMIIIE